MLKLDDNEKLIIVFRKHIFHFLTQLFGIILVALFPFVAYLLLGSLISFSPSSQSVYSFLFFYFILLVILWNIGFMLWTDYYLDMWISREVSSLRLDRIQDIKSEVLGLVHTFMGMGSVHVQTAGSEKEFVIHNIKKPEQVKEFILSAYNKQMEETKTAQAENETVIDHV